MTEGKPKSAYSFQAVWAKTILVGGTQFLKLRLPQLDGLTPAAPPTTGELITAALAVFDLCGGRVVNELG